LLRLSLLLPFKPNICGSLGELNVFMHKLYAERMKQQQQQLVNKHGNRRLSSSAICNLRKLQTNDIHDVDEGKSLCRGNWIRILACLKAFAALMNSDWSFARFIVFKLRLMNHHERPEKRPNRQKQTLRKLAGRA